MKEIKIGNSRLAYVEQKEDNFDISEAVGALDEFIHSSRQIELSVEQVIAYPDEDKWLVGREVIGFSTEAPRGIFTRDYSARSVLEIEAPREFKSYAELFTFAKKEESNLKARLLRIVFTKESFARPLMQYVMDS